MGETMTQDRAALKDAFIASTDWAGASATMVAGDASNRKYDRLTLDGKTAILMDAPVDKGEDIRPFVAVARYLLGAGLSAPQIMAEDAAHGFLILEDLGNDLYARVAQSRPELEDTIYRTATDCLIALHRTAPMAGLGRYDPDTTTPLAALAYEWYLGESRGKDAAASAEFSQAMHRALADHSECSVTILRDYHAENLLWLPDRDGAARVGLLDFQDAMIGDPAYDLVSMLMDARRDVSPDLAARMIRYYCDQMDQNAEAFETRYHVVGAQRNLRILGVFARLSRRDGKKHYVDLIPRVWEHLMTNLAHPALTDVAALIHRDLPAPEAPILDRLRR